MHGNELIQNIADGKDAAGQHDEIRRANCPLMERTVVAALGQQNGSRFGHRTSSSSALFARGWLRGDIKAMIEIEQENENSSVVIAHFHNSISVPSNTVTPCVL